MYVRPTLKYLKNNKPRWVVRFKKDDKIYQWIFKSYEKANAKLKEVQSNE